MDEMKPKPKSPRSPKRRLHAGGKWRMSDLPAHLQAELRDRIEQAKRGEDLHDFDEAMAEAERMTTEILKVINRRRSKA